MTTALIDPTTTAFRMKVLWFGDLLASTPARRYLWSLFLAGEAYEELHPAEVYVDRLEPRLGRLLARHLADETRHATVFRGLLAAEGLTPLPLVPHEDVGFHLLCNVVPDVVAAGRSADRFSPAIVQRYMAFLHVLELRSLGDLGALIVAAERRGETSLVRALSAIARDERFHATYTHRAVVELGASAGDPALVVDRVRRDERRHGTFVLGRILDRFRAIGAAPGSPGGRVRWRLMRLLVRLGVAVPLLPLYRRLPSALWPEPAPRLHPERRTQS